MGTLTIDPRELPVAKMHSYLLGAVAPRPIAFASTIDLDGNVNLSPFSFFNVFSANPPIMIFSPARRGRDNTTKHTYENVREVPEVVINIVNYAMVQQMSLASTEYDKGVNEFTKSGLSPIASTKINPPRVAEAPAAFECKVNQVIELGKDGGAGNLVICEVLLAHFKDEILDKEGMVDPFKLDAVARMGGDFYCRAHGDSIFKVPKPLATKGIGVDQIPEPVRLSKTLTGNDLGLLGNVEQLPSRESIDSFSSQSQILALLAQGQTKVHEIAQQYLSEGKLEEAWKLLLSYHNGY